MKIISQNRRDNLASRLEIDGKPETLFCYTCKKSYPFDSFANDKGCKYGKRPLCVDCSAKRKRGQYLESRLTKENTHPIPRGCEICGIAFDLQAKKGEKGKDTPHWDHIHEIEIFRGWLCHNCNSALGQFGDNYRILEIAIEYLKKRGANPSRPLIR
jgi:hypothetical protein